MTQRRKIQNQRLMLVTTNTAFRKPVFQDPACAREAVESLYRIQYFRPFFLFAFVIMPDHCHFLLEVPKGNSISKIMHAYKRAVSFEIGTPIWQPRYHLTIVDNPTPVINYIHMNPVQRNLCMHPTHYHWSSASGRWDVCEVGF